MHSCRPMHPPFVLLAILCTVVPAIAEPVELPIEGPLAAGKVLVELDDSRVHVLVDPEAEPSLRVVDLVNGEDGHGFALLEESKGTLRLGRPHGDEETAPRLGIDLVVAPSQLLEIAGRNLDVEIETTDTGEDEEEPDTAGDGSVRETPRRALRGARLTVDVGDSSVVVTGGTAIAISATGSRIELEGTGGPLSLDLDGGSVEVRRHVGPVRVRGAAAEFVLEDLGGALRFDLDGGSLVLRGGNGTADGSADGATLAVERWGGSFLVRGEEDHVEARELTEANAKLQVSGARHEVIAEKLAGALFVDLEDGTVSARGVGARLSLRLRDGAEAEVKGVGDGADIRVEEDASAKVEGIARRTSARVNGASLSLDNCRDLQAKVMEGSLAATLRAGKARVTATDSEVELDLAGSSQDHQLSLGGSARARVTMRDPCRVRVTGDVEDEGLLVSGCEVIGPDARKPPPVTRGRLQRRRVVTLDVELGDDASLEVNAAP